MNIIKFLFLFLLTSLSPNLIANLQLIYFTDVNIPGDVLEAQEFVEKIKNNFDFSKINLSELGQEEKDQLLKKHNIKELPRLVLVDEEGDEIGRYGIYGETPENIANELLSMKEKSTMFHERMKLLYDNLLSQEQLEELYKLALELKKDVKAAQVLAVGLKKANIFFHLEKYRFMAMSGATDEKNQLRKTIEELDPFNEGEAHFALALIDFQTAGGSKEAVHFLEKYLSNFGEKDQKNRWRVEMMIAQCYLNYDDLDNSLQHAEIAFKEAPEEAKRDIEKCCSYIKTQLKTLN